jgi:5-methyltetrahydropteroyltriglutamate--homocysteine methyltransferase
MLRWQDLFRPLAEQLGEKPHTLVRWFDTNTFFRAPELEDAVPEIARPDAVLADPSVPRPTVLTLPSPYTFSRIVHTTGDRNRLMKQLAVKVLRPVVAAAASRGVALIHFEEPWIAYEGIAASDWAPFREALETVRQSARIPIALHLYFGDASRHIKQLRELPVDAIGIDLVETEVDALGSGWDKALIAGIIDGRDSRVEPASRLVDALRYLSDRIKPPRLYLTSNCELSYLPTQVAERKIENLGKASRELKQLVPV